MQKYQKLLKYYHFLRILRKNSICSRYLKTQINRRNYTKNKHIKTNSRKYYQNAKTFCRLSKQKNDILIEKKKKNISQHEKFEI